MADLAEMKEIWFEYYRCYLGELFNSYTLGKYKWKVTKTFLWKWKGKESFYVLLWEKLPLHWFSMACAMQREKQPFQMFRSLVKNQSLRKDDFDIMVRKNTDGWSIIEHVALYTVKSDIGKVKWWERAALTSWACSLECFGRLQGCPPSARSFPGSSSLYFFFFLINWPA